METKLNPQLVLIDQHIKQAISTIQEYIEQLTEKLSSMDYDTTAEAELLDSFLDNLQDTLDFLENAEGNLPATTEVME